MKDSVLLVLLLVCLAVLVGLPVVLVASVVNQDVSTLLAQNIMVVKAAFVVWFVAIIVVSTAGNK